MKPLHYQSNLRYTSTFSQLISIIVKVAAPAMIYLIGCSYCHRKLESIVQDHACEDQELESCHLLVLLDEMGKKELYEWQDTIDRHCKETLSVTTLVFGKSSVEEWSSTGHAFARKVQSS